MKIMVFDVPAENGGALSVLNDFYKDYSTDEENEYIFVVSKPELKDTKNIKVLRFPWVKKSWFHRLYFDNFIAHKLVKKYEVDEILSLQNIIIPNCKCKQTLYVHNSIPFSEYRFSLRKNKLLWIYQNILGKKIFKSIIKADNVIVQTNWMKNECISKVGINESKIEVVMPNRCLKVTKEFKETTESLSTFFYPASAVEFKNHKIIVEACMRLKKEKINNYKVIFTIYGNENENIKKLYNIIKENNLPVQFIGTISKKRVFEYYTKSILIFPSLIETVGLPLLEARAHKSIIIANDTNFALEMLKGYNFANIFKKHSSEELKDFMKEYINISLIKDRGIVK